MSAGRPVPLFFSHTSYCVCVYVYLYYLQYRFVCAADAGVGQRLSVPSDGEPGRAVHAELLGAPAGPAALDEGRPETGL